MMSPKTVTVVHWKSARPVWVHHAHAQATGKSGDHAMVCAARATENESRKTRALLMPMATRPHHKSKPNHVVNLKSVSQASGANGPHAMLSVIHLG